MSKWILSRHQLQRLAWIGVVLMVLSEVARVYVSRPLGDWLFWLALGLVMSISLALMRTPKNGPP
jgi:nicotinamide riboside transporter PnuC